MFFNRLIQPAVIWLRNVSGSAIWRIGSRLPPVPHMMIVPKPRTRPVIVCSTSTLSTLLRFISKVWRDRALFRGTPSERLILSPGEIVNERLISASAIDRFLE